MKKSVCQIFNKNCLETGLKPDIPTINAAALEYVKRFPIFNVPAVAFSDRDFDETIAAYLPYPIVKVVTLGRTPVESKKVFPSIADCIRLLKAYAQGDQKLYNELEDRFMKPSKIASRRQFMETVIAWAFIFFYLKIRRDHRYFTALSFLLSSHTLLSYGSVTRDETGTVTGMARTSIDLGVTSSGALTHSRTTGTASSSATTLTASESQALSLSSAASSSNAVSREFARAMSQGLSERLSAGQSTAGSSSSSYSKSSGESSTVSRGLSNSENLSFTSGAKLQAGGGEAQFSTDAAKEAAKDAKGASSASSENLNLAAAQSSPAVLGAISTQSKDPEGKPVARQVQNAMSHLRGAAEAAGMGIGLEAKTAQQFVDTATGSQSAATQRQKAEAYHALKSTAKEIAASTSNDEMRRAAKNFSAALDKAYRSSNDQSRMLSETFSASRSQSENLSGTNQTAVNNDILVMQKLLSSDKLSAESHLKALFDSSDKREHLSASAAADSYDRAADVRHLGPGQIQETDLEQNALKRQGRGSLSALQHKGEAVLGKQEKLLKEKAEDASFQPSSLNSGLKDFNKKFDEQEETNSVGLMNQDAMTELRRDRIEDASANYLNEQKGMSTILLNSLAGGLGYREARVEKEAKDEN